MKKLIAGVVMSVLGLAATAAPTFADDHDRDHRHHWSAPEIDPASAITALTLLLGGVAVMRSRMRRK